MTLDDGRMKFQYRNCKEMVTLANQYELANEYHCLLQHAINEADSEGARDTVFGKNFAK